jgi:AcrR family transcriptional regulator
MDGGEVTVARLLQQVGCGRNTFYEHFDDAAEAVGAACAASAAELDTVVGEFLGASAPRTPGDAMRNLALTWSTFCQMDQTQHWTLLERVEGGRIEQNLLRAVQHIHHVLVRAGAASGALSDTHAAAVCGALRAVARVVHGRPSLPDDDNQHDIAEASEDVLVRLLR